MNSMTPADAKGSALLLTRRLRDPTAMPLPAQNVSSLISADEISHRLDTLAAEITRQLPAGPLTVVTVLKGAFIFAADLVRRIDRELQCDFLTLRSYGDATETSGVVEVAADLSLPVEGRHVLVLEDIVDTGLTLRYLQQILKARNPASLRVCALLDKPSRRRVDVDVDFVGFYIPDHFVVGYGLDAAQAYRNLPFIGVINATH
ncbi:MAG: hypoxanthine phosphoribosyltransferase [Deltaproteobacteria bacterium]|nr:hypoxanthine phosphoribosyltransferase [Deltaproteobacteria bacterium]